MFPEMLEVTNTVVQVVQGGDPEDDEFSIPLSDMRDPSAPSFCGAQCACGRTLLLYSFWDRLRRYDLFRRDTDLWLRAVPPQAGDTPLPAGARIIATHAVMLGVA